MPAARFGHASDRSYFLYFDLALLFDLHLFFRFLLVGSVGGCDVP